MERRADHGATRSIDEPNAGFAFEIQPRNRKSVRGKRPDVMELRRNNDLPSEIDKSEEAARGGSDEKHGLFRCAEGQSK
ncbi:hypothetical protein GmRootV35_56870 [Variovorax sp. V35]